MLKTYSDIRTDVIVKLGISTTSAYYTQEIIDDWIQQSTRWASSAKKWPFTEGKVSTTFAAGGGDAGDEYYFEGYKADAFRMVQIGGKRLRKLNFEDYQIMREEQPDSNDRVYSDYARTVYINPQIDLSGTLTAWGQYQPLDIDVTDENSVTLFSAGDEEGNEAIVEKVLYFANVREKKNNVALAHHQRAMEILDSLEAKVFDEQYQYQTHPSRGGIFGRIDVIDGFLEDEVYRRDQF